MTDESHPHTRLDAEVDRLVHALRSCGVLTHDRLREFAGADTWPDHNYEAAIQRGITERRIKQLGDDLYELDEAEQPGS